MLRVLIVDDDRDFRDSLRYLVETWGHEARAARDGPEALKVADSFQPDVVLLDLAMPGMDGYEVARRLRRIDAASPIIICVSAYGAAADVRKSREAGCNCHLIKPPDLDEVERMLRVCKRLLAPEPGDGSPKD